ncbi:hypothetical protein ACJQWK_04783 [Exserohilum turcicum]
MARSIATRVCSMRCRIWEIPTQVTSAVLLAPDVLISIQHSKMSAPNPGRQSPDPERQSGAQAGQISDNVNKQGAGPQEGAEQASDNTKNSLSSNPEHPLKQHSEETTSKKV